VSQTLVTDEKDVDSFDTFVKRIAVSQSGDSSVFSELSYSRLERVLAREMHSAPVQNETRSLRNVQRSLRGMGKLLVCTRGEPATV
jgi:hypothetical protein